MSGPRLRVAATLDIPLAEVSGICVHEGPDGTDRLMAIGDAGGTAVWAAIDGDGLGAWTEVDLAERADGAVPARDSQTEAIVADAAGRVLVMLEEPAQVVMIDAGGGPATVIQLVVPATSPVAGAWADEPNSRGEGLVLLAGGHLLVVKEKNPPALLEFGPPGDPPLGLGPDQLLGRTGTWQAPPGPTARFEALATWLLADALVEELGDVSDAAVDDDGCLHLLSDQSSRIAALDPVTSPAVAVTARTMRRIHGKPDKAEGLALLPDGRILVALDRKRPGANLLVLVTDDS